jgi:aspartyl-tRNA(Asn)/glutamyl-tRNA(Gln) amidotransferase subunit B
MSSPVLDYDEALAAFDPVLGLEVHVELNTASKMFCGCSTAFGAEPNTHTCPVCLGLPGSLPVVNAKAIESAIRIGLALNCTIADWCRFARKNYFYPDMTKDFQISQYDEPIAFDGYVDLEVDGEIFRIEIERAHMEEDAGKLLHLGGTTGRIGDAEYSLLDYNRAGTPLIEIVTKTIHGTGARAPQVAKAYVSFLRDLMVSLGVSDARMEQASLRCDANVSIMPKGTTTLGLRTETKNVNSLRSVEKALHHEICRQAQVLSSGGLVQQETRHWHEDGEYTTPGRLKSDAEDYRYFPEPDLVPVAPSREWVEELRGTLPELPNLRKLRLQGDWGFTDQEMQAVVNAGALDLVEDTVKAGATAQVARKWWTTDLARRANAEGVELRQLSDDGRVTPEKVVSLQELVNAGSLNDQLARQVIDSLMTREHTDPMIAMIALGLGVVTDDAALGAAVDAAIAANPDIAARIREGKLQAAGALIGAVMKDMRGQADAGRVRELILAKLA